MGIVAVISGSPTSPETCCTILSRKKDSAPEACGARTLACRVETFSPPVFVSIKQHRQECRRCPRHIMAGTVISCSHLLRLLSVGCLQLVCRPAQEQPLSIRQRDVLAYRKIRPVLGLITLYHELG